MNSTVEVTGFNRGSWVAGEATVALDVPRLRRLASKMALNAGALVWGDDFASSALADWLRDFLAVPSGPGHGRSQLRRIRGSV